MMKFLLRCSTGTCVLAGLFFACLSISLTSPSGVLAGTKHWNNHKEYRAIIHEIKPSTGQILLIDRIASTISLFSKLHPDIDRKIRETARKTLASRVWNEAYAKQLMTFIDESHTTIINDIYSDLYLLHQSLDDTQKQALARYLQQRLKRIDKEVEIQLQQAKSYGGVLGTLFVGFGKDQRAALQILIEAIATTYQNNEETRQDITRTLETILRKKEIDKRDIERYLKISRKEFRAYEQGIIGSVRNFLNSLDERQKGRIVYLFDDANRQHKEIVTK